MTFSCVPTDVSLDILPSVQAASWQEGQAFSAPTAQWRVYLNHVCLTTFLPWLQAEYSPTAASAYDASELPALWQLVDGTAIVMGKKRLVLLPTKTLDTSELRVPQEWVDHPEWVADYLLAVQVNPDEQWLNVWGYTTHAELKAHAVYDPNDRTYCVDAYHLIRDMTVLWTVQQLYPDEPTQSAIAPLPTLTDAQAERLFQQLAAATVPPRLAIPFEQWGALLSQPQWRQRLYQLQSQSFTSRDRSTAETSSDRVIESPDISAVNLSQWFQNVFDTTWEAIDTLINPDSPFAFNIRQTQAPTESLIRRVKQVRVRTQTVDQRLLLVLTLGAATDSRVEVQVQLYPVEGDRLPVNLRLAMLSTTRTVVQSVQAREQDDYIQLKRFKCAAGTRFELQIALGDFCFREEFVS
ncbi:MAG: DUF1822 family protein [Leptolyngbya sp. BL-A-14]